MPQRLTACCLSPRSLLCQEGFAEAEKAKFWHLVNTLVNKLHLLLPPQVLPWVQSCFLLRAGKPVGMQGQAPGSGSAGMMWASSGRARPRQTVMEAEVSSDPVCLAPVPGLTCAHHDLSSILCEFPCIFPTHKPPSQAQVPGHGHKTDVVPTVGASKLRKGMGHEQPP